MSKPTASGFNPDIQKLRGLSVLAVVLYHLFEPTVLPGGFLGVDVFFVISGYVITGSIFREYQGSGHFSLKSFYHRRIDRLYLPLLGIVALTLIVALIKLPSYQGRPVLLTGLFSLIGISNNYLNVISQNYFALETHLNPFIHTWSLGVEEQFYFLFSLLVWGVVRSLPAGDARTFPRLHNYLVWLGCLSFGIFIWQITWSGDRTSAFYLLPDRAWQPILGSIGFIRVNLGTQSRLFVKPDQKSFGHFGAVKWTAGCLLLAAFLFHDKDMSAMFPEVEIVYRLIASCAALVLCIPHGTVRMVDATNSVCHIFEQTFKYLGDKSYSIYLVHWPIISFGYWFGLNKISEAALIVGATGLSWIFLEEKNKTKGRYITVALMSALPVALTVVVLLKSVVASKIGPIELGSPSDIAWTATQKDVLSSLGFGRCSADLTSIWPDASCKLRNNDLAAAQMISRPRVLVVGDSHAEHLLWGVDPYAQAYGYDIALLPMRYPFGSISIHPDHAPALKGLASKAKHRLLGQEQKSSQLENLAKLVNPNDLLIFSSYTARLLRPVEESFVIPFDMRSGEFISRQQAFDLSYREFSTFIESVSPQIRILIVADTPVLEQHPATCFRGEGQCSVNKNKFLVTRTESGLLFRQFAAKFANVRIIDLAERLCDGDTCNDKNKVGNYLYRDTNHLSAIGGQLFFDLLNAQPFANSKFWSKK